MKYSEWTMTNRDYGSEVLGWLPVIFQADDERPASEQINARYAHGGGFMPFEGFELVDVDGPAKLAYAGDPDTLELARCDFSDKELLIYFQHSWLAIVDKQSMYFDVTRMD